MSAQPRTTVPRLILTTFATLVVLLGASTTPALAEVGWAVHSVADPSHFAPSDAAECASDQGKCDRYQLVVLNTGDGASSPLEPVTITDTLPSGLTTLDSSLSGKEVESESGPYGERWVCPEAADVVGTVTCTLSSPIAPGAYAPILKIPVTAPSEDSGTLTNKVTVTGGGPGAAGSTSGEVEIGSQAPPFGVTGFTFEALNANGSGSSQGGTHPSVVVTNIDFANVFRPTSIGSSTSPVSAVEQVKDVVVELPAGFVGDPQALGRCPLYDSGLKAEVATGTRELEEICASKSSTVGAVALDSDGSISTTGINNTSRVYNLAPEESYPGEFGFSYLEYGASMYASVVHTNAGYRLRVAVPGVTNAVGLTDVSLAFFGDAAAHNGAGGLHTAFLANPADCSEGPLEAKVEANSWEHPETWVSKTTVSYPQVEDCDLLQFEPKLQMAPAPSSAEGEGSSQADEPSAYDVNLEVPQKTLFEETATPNLKNTAVTLPAGVSVSPSAADGLEGCEAGGPNGIDMPSGNHLPDEAGEGEGIGSDGLSQLVAGHCPKASMLGTVEITTPLLEEPLKGHVYLAQPKCGGSGQQACTEASATNGELYGLYIEAAGSGVVVKLPGTVSANPQTGQLSATFSENPQLPFSDLRIHFHGGARAPIANPQTCGSYATSSTLSSWGGQEALGVSPSFDVDWDGHGGACPSSMPFVPGSSAGTSSPVAGAFSPFVLSFSRQDREQDLSGLSVTLPPGLLGKIAGIPLCGEAQANAGTCGPESQLGSASVLAGPGESPLYVSGGRVYLTTGYKDQPFGLSIVVPAVAGPFNLGNVVVRASIHIDPNTSQVTVTTDPLPQSRDGVPFRLRTVYTEINRPGFTFNPTNCAEQRVTGTISGLQGASASVSSPFAATGCVGLKFAPKFVVSTAGKASKADGASLDVKVLYPTGPEGVYANIRSVKVDLPKQLPSRLTTLQKACVAATFDVNPASCPAASNVGMATATTPVLAHVLTGPAYLVSHGGEAFPDLEIVLQGEGITLILDGNTQIKKGITSSTFKSIPDAPVSGFELKLPAGKYSILGANVPQSAKYSLCGQTLAMPTAITGQNGAVIKQTTKITVEGCAKAKALTRAQKLAAALKACRTKSKGKRAGCEQRARKRYASAKAGAKSKHNKQH
jgi:hypothetical protein